MSWLGNGATASLHNNDVIVYSGGESLWILSLPTLTWNEVWTNGQTPPHGLRFHTTTSLRLTSGNNNSNNNNNESHQIDRSKSTDSTTSANSIGALVVLGGEPRASYDLPEATQYGPKLNMHILKVRDRTWSVANCTGDIPDNRCMHTTTKLRGTTLAVYGGRPLGAAHPTNEEASPIFEDTNEMRAKLVSEGFYDVYLIDVNVGVWRRITPHVGGSGGGEGGAAGGIPVTLQPCLWGHSAFATSVFPARRSQNGEFRHRIDLVIQGGFDISPSTSHQEEMAQRARAGLVHNAFVLQPLSETQPTVLKWGLAPLVFDKNGTGGTGIPSDGEFTLHSAASPDSAREGAQPAFFLGGFSMKTEEDGEIGLAPTGACGRVSVRGTWQEGPKGQIATLPALDTLMKNFKTTARPLLLYYSDQLLVLESTEKFWLLDLQEQAAEDQGWAPVDTSLGSNEDVERWRIGCPIHPEFVAGDDDGEEAGEGENQQQSEEEEANRLRQQQQQEEQQQRKQQQEEQEAEAAAEKQRLKAEKKKAKEEKKKAKEEAKKLAKSGKPPKPKTGEVRGEWKALHDEKSGRQYYVNINTRKSTWKIQETSFNEPLPTETKFSSSSDDDDKSTDDDQQTTNNQKKQQQKAGSTASWRDATQGEPVRGYEASMMNPIYDTVNQNDVRAVDQQQQQRQSAAGTPEGHKLSRFLSASEPGIHQDSSVPTHQPHNQNWWSTAADARHRNEQQTSQSRPNPHHTTDGLNQSQARSDIIENNNKDLGKPPTGPAHAQPCRTPISQVGPPSGVPTPSIWNEPHIDLPIDSLLKGLDSKNNISTSSSAANNPYPHARRSSYHQNYQQQQQAKSRRKSLVGGGDDDEDEEENQSIDYYSNRRARDNSQLASLLLAPDLRKQKEEEERRKHQEMIEQQRELYRQQQEARGNTEENENSENDEEESAMPWMDPAEVLDYPFDVDTALLLPHETVLRARSIFINKKKDEIKIPQDRDLDVKKYLQSYTQYETMSEDQEREERKRQHYEKRHPQLQQQQQSTIHHQNVSTTSTHYRPRSVLDMLPSMLSTGKFSEFLSDENNDDKKQGFTSTTDNINPSSSSSNIKQYARPSPFIAAEYSRTGSAADWTESSRASTPVAAAHLDVVIENNNDDPSSRSRKSSVAVHQEESVPGLATHHVSQSIKDMLFEEEDASY